ncbi:MAG: 16S rRNA (adenine(1518)-N(6)/adenine(1519)-N(6))-dimethyltransferase RsmA [Elusimicrobiota bacterium]
MPAKFGQHFLVDSRVIARIADAVGARAGDPVLEIGPGRGALTRALLDRGADLTAVEMDERLIEALRQDLPTISSRLIKSDFLKIDLETLRLGTNDSYRIAANLPYAVGAPILQKILPWNGWTSAVLMFQKEVAERIAAVPGCADYGLLTLSVWIYAEAEILFSVEPGAFSPPPKVHSAVVYLRRRPEPLIEKGKSLDFFFRLAKAAFSQRRKMAASPISFNLRVPRAAISGAFEDCGLSPSCRAQDISPQSYARLAEKLMGEPMSDVLS